MDWVTWLQFTLTGLGAVATIMFGYAGIQAAIGYREQGKKQAKLDEDNTEINTNTLLKQRIEALEEKVKLQQEQMDELKKISDERQIRIEALYKENLEKNKKIEEYLEIFKGRDPKMQEFFDIMKKYVDMTAPLIKEIEIEMIPVIKDLKEYLHKQTF